VDGYVGGLHRGWSEEDADVSARRQHGDLLPQCRQNDDGIVVKQYLDPLTTAGTSWVVCSRRGWATRAQAELESPSEAYVFLAALELPAMPVAMSAAADCWFSADADPEAGFSQNHSPRAG
jgi:hypothetical protein